MTIATPLPMGLVCNPEAACLPLGLRVSVWALGDEWCAEGSAKHGGWIMPENKRTWKIPSAVLGQ